MQDGAAARQMRTGARRLRGFTSSDAPSASVYGGFVDKLPFGAVVNKAITIKSGQTHVQRYMRPLLERIERGEFDPSFIVSHRMSLDAAPLGYEMFKNKAEDCVKVVLKP